jgi:hypothetical protein
VPALRGIKNKTNKSISKHLMSSVSKKINAIEKTLEALKKLIIEKDSKPKSIDECTSKKQLMQFSTDQLKKWLKKNGISIDDTDKRYKKNLIKKIWEFLEEESDSDSESETDSSDSDSDSESDSDSD